MITRINIRPTNDVETLVDNTHQLGRIQRNRLKRQKPPRYWMPDYATESQRLSRLLRTDEPVCRSPKRLRSGLSWDEWKVGLA